MNHPLEFYPAEEARAATMGPFFQREYGCNVTPVQAPPRRASRHPGVTVESAPIDATLLDALLGGRDRRKVSEELGREQSYLSRCVSRGKIPCDLLEELIVSCEIGA